MLEGIESYGILLGIWVTEPDSQAIINESSPVQKMLAEVMHEFILTIDGHVDDGNGTGRWGAHGCSSVLFKHHVSKAEDIVTEDQSDGFIDCIIVHSGKGIVIVPEIEEQGVKSVSGVNVGVHTNCICSEDSDLLKGWKI